MTVNLCTAWAHHNWSTFQNPACQFFLRHTPVVRVWISTLKRWKIPAGILVVGGDGRNVGQSRNADGYDGALRLINNKAGGPLQSVRISMHCGLTRTGEKIEDTDNRS
jgi:hypothetical protein